MLKISAKFQIVHTRGEVGWNWRFLTNISLYLINGTRYGSIFYRTLIKTGVISIKWRYFQWLWATPDYLTIPFFAILYRLWYHIISYRTGAINDDLEWPSKSFTCCKHFNTYSASRCPSAVAELLILSRV